MPPRILDSVQTSLLPQSLLGFDYSLPSLKCTSKFEGQANNLLTQLAQVTATLPAINTTPNLYHINISTNLHCIFLHLCWGT